ncbi:pentatricopeptide repeat-containing protein At3g12770 [Cryptomeria japonica]|uniref:pentatricopeptide repeat-containing protein At3g12770 n=1 Tax=Cryptomeria japonica TaxID=3369 RepID=UPI0027DA65B9|nr:pentatricopeptide repeat-containing protein At3g12770 [Cryptomeria japonica]
MVLHWHSEKVIQKFKCNNFFLFKPLNTISSYRCTEEVQGVSSQYNLNPNTYACLLQACSNIKILTKLHARILIDGFSQDTFLATRLMSMYANCGSLKNSRLVFDRITNKTNVLLWNVIIGEYSKFGLFGESLSLYYQMKKGGIEADNFSFTLVLKACTGLGLSAIENGHGIHEDIVRAGYESDIYVANSLINMYGKCGWVDFARQIFDKMPQRDVVSWNSMIVGYAQNGNGHEALRIFSQMRNCGMLPSSITIVNVMRACVWLETPHHAKWIHGLVVKSGFDSDIVVSNSLLSLYTKCRSIDFAELVFDEMPNRSLVSWNAMIAGYAHNGLGKEALLLFNEMVLADVRTDSATLVSALQACAHLGVLRQGKCIHDYIIRKGFELDVNLGNSLVAMYIRCGSIENGRRVFDKMTVKDVITWSTLIAGYSQSENGSESMKLYSQMQLANIRPDSFTMVSVLQTCTHVRALLEGEIMHCYVIKSGFESDVYIGNSLIDMYSKCGRVNLAHLLFEKMSERNVVSWNSMLAGYVQNENAREAFTVFYQMQQIDATSDSCTMVIIIQACAHLRALHQGKCVHGYIVKANLDLDAFVQNSLIDMYAKCGNVDSARQLFDRMSNRNTISWTAMIGGYSHSGLPSEAMALFRQMQIVAVKPNTVTMVNVLLSSTRFAALHQGKQIHGYIIKSGFHSDVGVGTALIDTYANCGSVEIARQLFDQMPERNVVSWSTMIAGYGMHGLGEEAIMLFRQMQLAGEMPNHITFVSLLSACSHAGLVEQGWKYFNSMTQNYSIVPKVEHYACMVDLLGRAGHLNEAWDFIRAMPLEPSASVWGALLGACRIHSNIHLGHCVAEHLLDLEPDNAGCYILLSNIYAAAGRWDDVAKMRLMMKERGLKKTPGYSLIEVSNSVQAFLVGDRSHPQSGKIYKMLDTLTVQMEEAGYVPDTNFVLHDVEEELKEDMLSTHSEKLAIAFGIINTSPGTPLRITKNLRVCGDCHNAAKFISKIADRDIYMRDANRFHHFKDGLCSCRDYW